MRRDHYVGRDVRRALTIDDLRAMAERRLPRMVFEYLEGGAEDERTLRSNREAFERWEFVPRTLVAVPGRSLGTTLFGAPAAAPLIIAPTGFNGMLTRDADVALASAARSAGIPFTLSTASSCSIEEVAQRAGGDLWFQLYPIQNRGVVESLVRRAAQAGYRSLVVTSDVPVYGNREWDRRNYVAMGRPRLRAKLDALAHPRWLFDVMIPHGAPRFANLTEFLPPERSTAIDGALYMTTQLNPRLDWEEVRWLRDLWPGRLLVKGILSAEDARTAAAQGLDGIVLSNHGGRQLDGAIAPLSILPEVAREVGDRITLIVDSGFRRGSDVVKALALGAHAVMLGRAVLYGVAAGGEAGAARALSIMTSEMDRVLALLGCRAIGDLGDGLLRRAAAERASAADEARPMSR